MVVSWVFTTRLVVGDSTTNVRSNRGGVGKNELIHWMKGLVVEDAGLPLSERATTTTSRGAGGQRHCAGQRSQVRMEVVEEAWRWEKVRSSVNMRQSRTPHVETKVRVRRLGD